MGVPLSLPKSQPQPAQLSYGVESLELFQTFDRDSYRTSFGVDAPWWDPTRPKKCWFDSTVDLSDPQRNVHYGTVQQLSDGTWGTVEFMLPAQIAATVNIPGVKQYTPYILEPTGATRGGSPLRPEYLSLESSARALMAETGALALVDEGASLMYGVVYPADEKRRMWALRYSPGGQVNVGALIQSRHEKGVDSPGHWDVSSGYPVWNSDPRAPDGMHDLRPPVPVPVRGLLPNEALRPAAITALGPMGVEVVRTDLELNQQASQGWFTAADRQTLMEVHQGLQNLLKRG